LLLVDLDLTVFSETLPQHSIEAITDSMIEDAMKAPTQLFVVSVLDWSICWRERFNGSTTRNLAWKVNTGLLSLDSTTRDQFIGANAGAVVLSTKELINCVDLSVWRKARNALALDPTRPLPQREAHTKVVER